MLFHVHYHYFTVRQASWRQRSYFRHFLFFYGPGDHTHSLVWVLYSYPLNHLSIPFSLSVSFYFAVRSCSLLIYLILQFQPSHAVISRWLILGDNRINLRTVLLDSFFPFHLSECVNVSSVGPELVPVVVIDFILLSHFGFYFENPVCPGYLINQCYFIVYQYYILI